MKKTQKTFKKKYVVYGVMAFAGIALVSSGFATWVLANDSSASGSGNVTVGAVTEGKLGIALDNPTADFKFEPEKGDTSGRVRFDGNEDEKHYEILSNTFTGQVTNCQFLANVTVKMTVSDGVLAAAGYKQDENASSNYITSNENHKWVADDGKDAKHYITLPDCVTSEVELSELDTTGTTAFSSDNNGINKKGSDTTDNRNFQYTVAFGWGTTFGGQNPGKYYDDDPTGKTIAYNEVSTTLTAFHTLVGSSTYTVTFFAHNN